MNKITLAGLLLLIPLSGFCDSRQDLLTFESHYSVNQTAERLVELLKVKGFTVFKKIDHSQGAKTVGIELRETLVVIFGNPKVGSKLMQCNPTIAIDLPQKALIWQDANDKVWMSVNNPSYLKERHNVQGCDKFFDKITTALKGISNKVTQ